MESEKMMKTAALFCLVTVLAGALVLAQASNILGDATVLDGGQRLDDLAPGSKRFDILVVGNGRLEILASESKGLDILASQSNSNVVELTLTNVTGSILKSESPFLFGRISAKIKLVGGNSAGTVTSFYMASSSKNWGELDFEFLGNVTGQPYILQTNVFTEGLGAREQRIYLWFDPTADFHEYAILWNQNLVLFLVDGIAIRVFHNTQDLGIPYLDYQPMHIYYSFWNGESWATRGGLDKTDWSQQPFVAQFTKYDAAAACEVKNSSQIADIQHCYEQLYKQPYGQAPNLELSESQILELNRIKDHYLVYDYCLDTNRTTKAHPECARNWP